MIFSIVFKYCVPINLVTTLNGISSYLTFIVIANVEVLTVREWLVNPKDIIYI